MRDFLTGPGPWGLVVLLGLAAALPGVSQGPGAPSKHPVLQSRRGFGNAETYERRVERIMAMSEAAMLDLIPVKSPILFCACPHCRRGQQEMRGFEWTIEHPREMRCSYCNTVYPNEQYAPNRTAQGTNSLGEPVTYAYYYDEASRRDFWLEARIDLFRRDWFVDQCLDLARAYHLTQKPEYARRAALILDRFAWAYPRMAVLNQWPYRRREIAAPTPPYPHTGGKWGRWSPDEIPHSLPEAYDLIHDSPELDRLSREQGVDVRQRIERDFFRATVAHMFAFGQEPSDHFNNMVPSYAARMVNLGRVLEEPEYVHWVHRWVNEMLRNRFFYDGMWCEAPSYHYQVVGGIQQVLRTLRGYSDPPGYRHPQTGLRLENVDLERDLPFLAKAIRSPDVVAYPSGMTAPIHDTWASPGRRRGSPVREETRSTLLPGFGHAALGWGRGANQLQAQLHFSGAFGHSHADNLNLALFAKQSELFSDIGYNHGKLRHWTTSTVGHNTVVIDRRDQVERESDGDLLMFVPGVAGVSVVEARGERGYPRQASVYRRMLILVPVSDTDAYVVDVFRVRGGATHDWLLHGSADADMTAECSLELSDPVADLLEPGEKWSEPIGESSRFIPYGLIRDVRRATSGEPFRVTFRYSGGPAPLAGTGVRTHMLGAADTQVLLGNSPRIRQAEREDSKVYDYLMPQLVVRRRGVAPLASTFIAVHEPFRDQAWLESVQPLPLLSDDASAIALQVRHGDAIDTILCTAGDEGGRSVRLGDGKALDGRLAIVRQRAGRMEQAWLIDGQRLDWGERSLSQESARYEGTIESSERKADGAAVDAFTTSQPLPEGDVLAGQWMIVTHGNGMTHGYEIERVERKEDRSVVVLRDDHGLLIAGNRTEEYYFPRRTFMGPNRFVVHAATHQPAP